MIREVLVQVTAVVLGEHCPQLTWSPYSALPWATEPNEKQERTMFNVPSVELCGELLFEFVNVGLNAHRIRIAMWRIDCVFVT